MQYSWVIYIGEQVSEGEKRGGGGEGGEEGEIPVGFVSNLSCTAARRRLIGARPDCEHGTHNMKLYTR